MSKSYDRNDTKGYEIIYNFFAGKEIMKLVAEAYPHFLVDHPIYYRDDDNLSKAQKYQLVLKVIYLISDRALEHLHYRYLEAGSQSIPSTFFKEFTRGLVWELLQKRGLVRYDENNKPVPSIDSSDWEPALKLEELLDIDATYEVKITLAGEVFSFTVVPKSKSYGDSEVHETALTGLPVVTCNPVSGKCKFKKGDRVIVSKVIWVELPKNEVQISNFQVRSEQLDKTATSVVVAHAIDASDKDWAVILKSIFENPNLSRAKFLIHRDFFELLSPLAEGASVERRYTENEAVDDLGVETDEIDGMRAEMLKMRRNLFSAPKE